ncbi:FAD binding domain-containing protein [Fusarium redolens]|uniref:FAD binding domain-containing protein n=1 Tax=Fusarium redolens TaxID=48865 RepID=A0A9P9JQM0_FUSRE|nr:FAD binding domain-containing protein [Fusarium redolens]KAH7213326.1 FAD binding domain-containing protein [Fusarium redolens]
MATTQETSVVIVGGSLVGLSTALFLSHLNIPTILIERHRGSSLHPRAIGYTARTIELFRTVGVESKLKGIQWSGGPPRRIVVESLAGKWAKEQGWTQKPKGGPPVSFAEYSPTEGVAIAQDVIEPVLRDRARELGADLRLGFTVTGWSQNDNGVTVDATGSDGDDIRIKARYMVACDGNRSCIRESLGIQRHGVGLLRKLQSIMFRCEPLQHFLNHGYSQFQIEGREDGFEAFMTTYGGGRWMLAWNQEVDDPEAVLDEATQHGMIRKASGVQDLRDRDIELITTGKWDIGGLIADKFSSGRVFLAGDAAHALPPNRGGYGANTGIADAHNLAWKLASVLRGESLPELLDTYDIERRPVADVRHDQIFAREDYKRYVVGKEWPGKNVEIMDDVAMEFGYFYNSKSIIGGPDGSVPVKRPDEWNGQPGTRAPHVALQGEHTSTLDFFGTSWVVISKDESWSLLVAEVEKGTDVKIAFVHMGGDVAEKNDGSFNKLFGLEDTGASLVRPDGFVAWRAKEWPAEAQKELTQALVQVMLPPKHTNEL